MQRPNYVILPPWRRRLDVARPPVGGVASVKLILSIAPQRVCCKGFLTSFAAYPCVDIDGCVAREYPAAELAQVGVRATKVELGGRARLGQSVRDGQKPFSSKSFRCAIAEGAEALLVSQRRQIAPEIGPAGLGRTAFFGGWWICGGSAAADHPEGL